MILDTNAISALLEGDPAIEVVLRGADRHHLPVVCLGDYRFGLHGSTHWAALEALLDRLEAESIVLDVDTITARRYAAIRRDLKTKGRPIPENDIWIAALAQQHRLPIVTRDRHFDAVKSLRCVAW